MRNTQYAFTMIELMLAVTILSAGLVLIIQSLSSGMRALSRAQVRFLAASIATQKIEDLEELELVEGGLEQQSIPQESVTKDNKDFSVSVEVVPQQIDLEEFPQDFLSGEEPDYFPKIEGRIHKITVRVNWQEKAKSQDELVLSTYLNAKQPE